MNNINLNPVATWTGSDVEKSSIIKDDLSKPEVKIKPDISNDIELFEKLLCRLEKKYQKYPHKILYDAICTLEISINSLKTF